MRLRFSGTSGMEAALADTVCSWSKRGGSRPKRGRFISRTGIRQSFDVRIVDMRLTPTRILPATFFGFDWSFWQLQLLEKKLADPSVREVTGRQAGRAVGPAIGGFVLSNVSANAPFLIAGVLKIFYDLSLWRSFRKVRSREEAV